MKSSKKDHNVERNKVKIHYGGKEVPVKDVQDHMLEKAIKWAEERGTYTEYLPTLYEEIELRLKIKNSPLGKALT